MHGSQCAAPAQRDVFSQSGSWREKPTCLSLPVPTCQSAQHTCLHIDALQVRLALAVQVVVCAGGVVNKVGSGGGGACGVGKWQRGARVDSTQPLSLQP